MDSSDEEYELEYEPESFLVAGKISLEVLSVVPPPLEFMSELHTQNQEISGRQVWCGSLLMANVLSILHDKDEAVFKGKRILELGTGTGLLGMVVSKLGNPGCVILTDGDEKAIDLLEKNLANENNHMDSEVTRTKILRWGDEKQQSHFSIWCQSTWPDIFSRADVSFDYIIAGDVMYKEELPPLFFSACNDFLAPGGTLWLCHIPRASVDHDLVVAEAKKAGFACEEFPSADIKADDVPIEDRERAKVYRITKA